jgi:hypothetical protein
METGDGRRKWEMGDGWDMEMEGAREVVCKGGSAWGGRGVDYVRVGRMRLPGRWNASKLLADRTEVHEGGRG